MAPAALSLLTVTFTEPRERARAFGVYGAIPAELVISFGLGLAFGPLANTALVGVANHDAGVASALVNTAQQVGGSLGTALLNTIFTSAVGSYVVAHQATATSPQQLQAPAVVHSYTVAFWVSAALIGFAALITALLVRARRDQLALQPAVG